MTNKPIIELPFYPTFPPTLCDCLHIIIIIIVIVCDNSQQNEFRKDRDIKKVLCIAKCKAINQKNDSTAVGSHKNGFQVGNSFELRAICSN